MEREITIYRKRHIPNEIVKLDKDVIVKYDGNVLVTTWDCIRPRDDINHGISAYFCKDGYKISKMFDADNKLVYWYCDIMTMMEGDKEGELVYEDMLLDVIIFPDGKVEVVDADEFAQAMENEMISKDKAIQALKSLDKLLKMIYSGKFSELTKDIDSVQLNK